MTSGEASRFRLSAIVFFVLFASYACFAQHPNWNSTSRLALTAQLSQHGELSINGYEKLTGDRASTPSGYYSDKAPSMSLLAVPMSLLVTRFFTIEPDKFGTRWWTLYMYLCTLSVAGFFSALAAAAMFLFVSRTTASIDAALIASLTFGLATPMFGWSTVFFGHATAAALLLLGFIAWQDGEGGRWLRIARFFAGGLALGVATGVEFPTAIPAAIIGVAMVIRLLTREQLATTAQLLGAALLGGVIGLAPTLIYNDAAFGSPLHLGYSNVVGFDGMKSGFFGIGLPSIGVVKELLVGSYRGVLWFCPALIVLIAAWCFAVRQRALREVSIVTALVTAWYLFYNAGYIYWDGGWSTGPRFLTPAFGLPCLVLGLVWPSLPNRIKPVFLAVIGLSVIMSLAAVSVDMAAPENDKNPLLNFILPSFLSGNLTSTLSYYVLPRPSILHLVPILAIWALGLLLIARESSRDEPVRRGAG